MAKKKNNNVEVKEVRVVGPMTKGMVKTLTTSDSLVVRLNTYPADPTAIKLETTDGNEVGFVAARPSTADGYPVAKDVYDMVAEGDLVQITSIDPFLVGIPVKNVAAAPETIKKSYWTLLAGNKLNYPNRMKVASASRKNGSVAVEFKVDNGDALVFSYEGVPCGIATGEITSTAKQTLNSKGIKLTDVADIIAAINASKETTATIKFLDGLTMPVEITVEVKEEVASVTAPSGDYKKLLKSFAEADAAEVQKRIDWAKNGGAGDYTIPLIVEMLKGHTNIVPFAPTYIPHGKEIENAIAFSYAKANLLLAGPAGSGKNEFITTWANFLDRTLIDKSCSAGVDEEGLYGFLSMKASEECPSPEAVNAAFTAFIEAIASSKIDREAFANASVEEQIETIKENGGNTDYSVLFDAMRSQTAQIQFEPSILTKALEKPAIINLDEVNTLRPTVTSSLHSALDKRRSILINGYKNIDLHEDVLFTATMNEGSEYAGTNMLNLAFEDRWHVIEFEAPDNIAEILKKEVPTLPAKAVKVLNELYKKLKSVRGVEIQERSFSQRAFIYAAQNIALGNDIKSAIMCTIVPKIRDAEDREAVKAIVDLMIK